MKQPPVKEGDELELEIISEGAKGDGVAKIEGYVVFIPEARQGEVITARIKRVMPKMAFAEKVA